MASTNRSEKGGVYTEHMHFPGPVQIKLYIDTFIVHGRHFGMVLGYGDNIKTKNLAYICTQITLKINNNKARSLQLNVLVQC